MRRPVYLGRFGIVLAVLFTIPAPSLMEPTDDVLSPYRWKHRLLLIFAADTMHPAYETQVALLEGEEAALAERDVLTAHLFADGGSRLGDRRLTHDEAEAIRQRFGVAPGQFAVILVGKDGTEKRRDDAPVKPEVLYADIDAMPMRRREMQARDAGA